MCRARVPQHTTSNFLFALWSLITAAICLHTGFALCYDWYRERCVDAALEEAYPGSDSDDEKFIKRPNAEKHFEVVVESSPSTYSVVVGSHGTGKSTLAWNLARKTQGVIYVNVPPTVKTDDKEYPVKETLDSALREALGLRIHIPTWFPVVLSKLFHMAGKLLQPGKQVLIIVFIVPRTEQFLPRRLAAKQRNSKDVEGFRAGCRPLSNQA